MFLKYTHIFHNVRVFKYVCYNPCDQTRRPWRVGRAAKPTTSRGRTPFSVSVRSWWTVATLSTHQTNTERPTDRACEIIVFSVINKSPRVWSCACNVCCLNLRRLHPPSYFPHPNHIPNKNNKNGKWRVILVKVCGFCSRLVFRPKNVCDSGNTRWCE